MRFLVQSDERGWHVYDSVAGVIIGSTYATEQGAEEAAAADERVYGDSDFEVDELRDRDHTETVEHDRYYFDHNI